MNNLSKMIVFYQANKLNYRELKRIFKSLKVKNQSQKKHQKVKIHKYKNLNEIQ